MRLRSFALAGAAFLALTVFADDALAAPPAKLDVDTSAVGDAGPVVKRRLEERGATILRELGVPQGEAHTLRLTVQEFGGDAPGFELTAVLVRGGAEVDGTRAVVVCSLCTEGELVDRAEAELRKLVEALEALPPEPTVTDDPTGPAAGDGGGTSDDPGRVARDGGRAPLGAMGWSGVGLLAVGGVATLGGVVLAVLPPQPLESDPTQERYTSTAGYVTLGAGVVSLATGAALLGVDRRRARVSASASASRSHAHVNFTLRF